MELNYLAIIVATVVDFVIGAVWYSALFGKLWGKFHGFDKLSKAEQDRLAKSMGPFYAVQAIVTFITVYILALFLAAVPTAIPYEVASLVWLGFILPTQISAVIFGNVKRSNMIPMIAIQSGAAFICIEAAAFVLTIMR